MPAIEKRMRKHWGEIKWIIVGVVLTLLVMGLIFQTRQLLDNAKSRKLLQEQTDLYNKTFQDIEELQKKLEQMHSEFKVVRETYSSNIIEPPN